MPVTVTLITADDSESTAPTIAEQAAAPKRMTVDGQTVEQHSLAEQIEADRYAKSQQAVTVGLGIKYRKFVPSGSV